jgi:hypothetical protein
MFSRIVKCDSCGMTVEIQKRNDSIPCSWVQFDSANLTTNNKNVRSMKNMPTYHCCCIACLIDVVEEWLTANAEHKGCSDGQTS